MNKEKKSKNVSVENSQTMVNPLLRALRWNFFAPNTIEKGKDHAISQRKKNKTSK